MACNCWSAGFDSEVFGLAGRNLVVEAALRRLQLGAESLNQKCFSWPCTVARVFYYAFNNKDRVGLNIRNLRLLLNFSEQWEVLGHRLCLSLLLGKLLYEVS